MAWRLSDTFEANFEGSLLKNGIEKVGLFTVKTRVQRNTVLKYLYRELDGGTTTLCFVSGDNAIYELISNPSTDGTTDQDWKKLDFGVSDILVSKGTWDADNTTPVLQDTDAVAQGNDFYIVTGAPTPVGVQHTGLFQGQLTTVKDGDWVISNGEYWFVSASPINWDSISGIPTVINDYVFGTVIAHSHEIIDVNGLQDALDLKFDISNVADNTIDYSTVPTAKLITKLVLDTNFYKKTETYTQTQVNNLLNLLSPLTTKGDLLGHDGVNPLRIGVGADGLILVADSTKPHGFDWKENPAGLPHDYSVFYVDLANGSDASTGGINDPFKQPQAAYDAIVAIGSGSYIIRIMTAGTYAGLVMDDDNVWVYVQGAVKGINLGGLTCSDVDFYVSNIETIGNIILNQTAANWLGGTFDNCNCGIVTGSVNDQSNTQIIFQGVRTAAVLTASTPDINIQNRFQAKLTAHKDTVLTDVSLDLNTSLYSSSGNGAGNITITNLTVFYGHINGNSLVTLTVTGTYTAVGVKYVLKEQLIVSGTRSEITGEWAESLKKQEIAATLAVPFTKLITKIAPLTITGPTEFTVDTTDAEFGNMTFRRVTADGTNEPTFAHPFQKWLTLRDYDNTNGTVNVLACWFDGVSYYRRWGQAEPLETTAPTLSNYSIEDANKDRILFDSSEIITGTTFGGFTLADPTKTITGITIAAGLLTGHYFTVSVAYDSGDASPTIAYSGSGSDIEDLAENALESFTAAAITNNITAPPTMISFTIEDATDDVVDCVASEAIDITIAGWNIDTDGAALSISSVLSGSGTTTPKLQLSRSVLSTETLNMDYDSATGNTIASASPNLELEDITDDSVDNNVVAGGWIVGTAVSAIISGVNNENLDSSVATPNWETVAQWSQYMPSRPGVEGEEAGIQAEITTLNHACAMGMHSSNSPTTAMAATINIGSDGNYAYGGFLESGSTGVAFQVGDLYRIKRITKSAGDDDIEAEYYRSGSWNSLHVWAALLVDGNYYMSGQVRNNGDDGVYNLESYNLIEI